MFPSDIQECGFDIITFLQQSNRTRDLRSIDVSQLRGRWVVPHDL